MASKIEQMRDKLILEQSKDKHTSNEESKQPISAALRSNDVAEESKESRAEQERIDNIKL